MKFKSEKSEKKKYIYIYTSNYGDKRIYFLGMKMPLRHFIIGLIFLILAIIFFTLPIIFTPIMLDLVSIIFGFVSLILTITTWIYGIDRDYLDTRFGNIEELLRRILEVLSRR